MAVGAHNLTLIALDGRPIQPRTVASFVMYAGNRVDAVVCATALGASPSVAALVDFPLVFSSVSQRSGVCPWWPDRCQMRVAALLRYTPNSLGTEEGAAADGGAAAPGALPPTTTHLAVAAAAASQGWDARVVADPQHAPRDFASLGGARKLPRATRVLRLELGFLVSVGGMKTHVLEQGHNCNPNITPHVQAHHHIPYYLASQAETGLFGGVAYASATHKPYVPPTFPALLSK